MHSIKNSLGPTSYITSSLRSFQTKLRFSLNTGGISMMLFVTYFSDTHAQNIKFPQCHIIKHDRSEERKRNLLADMIRSRASRFTRYFFLFQKLGMCDARKSDDPLMFSLLRTSFHVSVLLKTKFANNRRLTNINDHRVGSRDSPRERKNHTTESYNEQYVSSYLVISITSVFLRTVNEFCEILREKREEMHAVGNKFLVNFRKSPSKDGNFKFYLKKLKFELKVNF